MVEMALRVTSVFSRLTALVGLLRFLTLIEMTSDTDPNWFFLLFGGVLLLMGNARSFPVTPAKCIIKRRMGKHLIAC